MIARRARVAALTLALALTTAACSKQGRSLVSDTDSAVATGDSDGAPIESDLSDDAEGADPAPSVGEGQIIVDTGAVSGRFDRRLLGTNLPAWVGPDRVKDPVFHGLLRDLGTTVIRMPGGSWSNNYNWLGCERSDPEVCGATWAAKPSDFAEMLARTGLEGMWTVNFNGTAHEAAALVAYFNAEVGDSRPIGVDIHGTDWGTVGQWAELRSQNGHSEPVPIGLWEIGNEIYGAKSDAGPECAAWGWEDSWTCDGEAYLTGDATHDGYLRFFELMKMVDPTIEVGAVGIGGPQGEWGNFGNEVIYGAAQAMDFYIVHDYGFDQSPSVSEVLSRPIGAWDTTTAAISAAADDAGRSALDVAVTEYNLIAFSDGDTEGYMAEAVNCLYIADTIGQMAMRGVDVANQWNLLNGVTPTGSDYGIFDPETLSPNPQFYALALWSRFGDEMLAVDADFEPGSELSAYAGRSADGSYTVIVINKTPDAIDATLVLDGLAGSPNVTELVVSALSPDAQTVKINGRDPVGADLSSEPPREVGTLANSRIDSRFAPYSITLLTIGDA